MKNVKKLCISLLALTMLLGSCTQEPEETETTTKTEETTTEAVVTDSTLTLIDNGKAKCTIIVEDNPTDAVTNAVKALQEAIKKATGAMVLISHPEDVDDNRTDLELLIGDTDREESTATIDTLNGYWDYALEVRGNKLVFAGQNDDTKVRCIYYFINKVVNKLDSDVKTLSYSSKNNYYYYGSYPMENLTILEKNISNYQIVIPKDATITESRFASYYREYLCEMTGVTLPIVTDEATATETEIRIGKTARTSSTVSQYEYVIATKGSCVEILAESVYGYESAYTYCLNSLLTKLRTLKAGTQEVVRTDISSELSDGTELILSKTGDLRIMYHNIWGWNESETNPTEQRNQMLASTYLEYDPDVLCLQECTMMMRNPEKYPISETLAEAGYAEVEVPAVNGKETATPIYYKTDVLTLVAKGNVKFATGGGDDKFITWAVFETISGKQTFGVISVHLAYQLTADGDNWRYEQAGEVIDLVNELKNTYKCPVITGGDMNCTTTSTAYERYINAGFADIQGLAERTESMNTNYGYPTFNKKIGMFTRTTITNFGTYADNAIDHVFVSGNGLSFKTYDIVTDNYVMCASDHTPTLVDFSFGTGSTTGPTEWTYLY